MNCGKDKNCITISNIINILIHTVRVIKEVKVSQMCSSFSHWKFYKTSSMLQKSQSKRGFGKFDVCRTVHRNIFL